MACSFEGLQLRVVIVEDLQPGKDLKHGNARCQEVRTMVHFGLKHYPTQYKLKFTVTDQNI
jgi:hypothetical protein